MSITISKDGTYVKVGSTSKIVEVGCMDGP
jgi:hypothetical protein